MTLDEAIKHAEEVTNANEKMCKTVHPAMQLYDYAKYAEEHRQLAEWLKELKQLREKEPCEDCISRQEALSHKHIVYDDDGIGYSVIRADVIEKLPTLTPNAKTGHWIDIGDSEKCSACNGTLLKEFHTFNGKEIWVKANFCPICGSYNGGDEG